MKRFYEATNDYVFDLIFINSQNSYTIKLTKKNYSNIEKLIEEVRKQSVEDTGSDDVWIEEVILVKGISKEENSIDWTLLLGELDQDIVDLLYEEDDISFKLLFCRDYFGNRMTADDVKNSIEEIYVINNPDWVYSNDDERYPESLVEDVMENFYPNLLKELEKANAESYFDAVNIVRDMGYNGDIRDMIVGDTYIYSWGDL